MNKPAEQLNKNNKGFTLIELLVVISIVGLVSTFAMVSFTNAREKSRDGKRTSDMRTLQSAVELYINDQDKLPGLKDDGASWMILQVQLSEYVVGGELPDPPNPDTCMPGNKDFNGDCYGYCAHRDSFKYLLTASFEQRVTINGDVDGNAVSYEVNECTTNPNGRVFDTPSIECDDDNPSMPTRFCLGTL